MLDNFPGVGREPCASELVRVKSLIEGRLVLRQHEQRQVVAPLVWLAHERIVPAPARERKG